MQHAQKRIKKYVGCYYLRITPQMALMLGDIPRGYRSQFIRAAVSEHLLKLHKFTESQAGK
jgi:hypothetical protein